jgi:hypothetical protein
MNSARRIYLYLVTFAALSAFAVGIANLIRALLEEWVSTASATNPGYLQDQVAMWGAAALVALPVWAVHWMWAQRLAAADSTERSSVLRRLFLYAALAGATAVAWIALDEVLTAVVLAVVGSPIVLARVAIPPLPLIVMAFGVWAYHRRVTVRDRDAVGETGGSATLRRWYTYGFAALGVAALLSGAQTVLMSTWLAVTSTSSSRAFGVSGASEAMIGLAVWGLLWAWFPRTLDAASHEQEQRSTLHSVYLFLVLTLVLVGTLSGISQAVYYLLARVLGVGAPGGVGDPLIRAAAGPVSVAIVYGAGWLYQRQVIAGTARELEAPRQVGVRRISMYLTALVALAVLAAGLAGLLWILGDVISQAPNTVGAEWWRDRLSLFATLTIIGLPVWLFHWRPRQRADARSLARRVYLYVSLIGAVLALLGGGAAAAYRLLSFMLGSASTSTVVSDFSHAVAIALVATGISAYQWRIVRGDMQSPVPAVTGEPAPAHVLVELGAPTAEAIDAALQVLRERGLSVRLRIA